MTNKEEYDPSFKEATHHSRIVCKCGCIIWYGFDSNHLTRPMYCSECIETEYKKLMCNAEIKASGKSKEQVINFYLKRGIDKSIVSDVVKVSKLPVDNSTPMQLK